MKKYRNLIVLLMALFLTLGCSISGLFFGDSTATSTLTFTPQPTATATPTPTLTPTPIPTETPMPTTTVYPLSKEAVLQEIGLQEDDLLEFFTEVGIPTDEFVDGSVLVIKRKEESVKKRVTWQDDIPEDLVGMYWVGYASKRDWQDDRMPISIAFHQNTILVFETEMQARKFFTSDVAEVDADLKVNMPTIGDESVAFSGYLGGYSPIGGVIWRTKNVYVSFSAELNFEVAPESLITISKNIEARLAEAVK